MANIIDFDLWDQATLTDVITKPLQRKTETRDGVRLGDVIAPLTPHQEMQAKLRVADVKAFGKGQFRAPAATPPLFKTALTWREEIIGLVLLDEMEQIDEEDWRKLNSSDPNVRKSSGNELVIRGEIARLRNERLTEAMRWAAFSGALVITYPTGDKLHIDYGLPAGHQPTASTLWSDVANADPVADVQAWSEKIADDSGFYGTRLHMGSKVWDYLIRNTKIKEIVTWNEPRSYPKRPTKQLILEVFQSFAAQVDVVIYDQGYRDVGVTGEAASQVTRYLPEDHVLLTTDYVLDGQRIAETLDGPVTVSTGYNTTATRVGTQAEVMLDHMSKTHFLRLASARIPRLLMPETFVWAKIA